MKIARVIGSVVNTIKLDSLNGYKLLWVEPIDENGVRSEQPILAVDTVQSGIGNIVLVCQEGKSNRLCMDSKTAPVEAAIVGVIDTIEINGRQTTLRDEVVK